MKVFHTGMMVGLAGVALVISTDEGRAEHKLCINDSTGATRVIEAPQRCRKAETAVVIPHEADGEKVKASSYVLPGSVASGGRLLTLNTENGDFSLSIACNYGGTDAGHNTTNWYANTLSVTAGSVTTFNNIKGEPLRVFNDLYYGGGGMDQVTPPSRPWTGVFTAKQGNAMSRFEVTVSDKNARGDCLVTLFSIGLGSVTISVPPP